MHQDSVEDLFNCGQARQEWSQTNIILSPVVDDGGKSDLQERRPKTKVHVPL